jgi:hypothetical protein
MNGREMSGESCPVSRFQRRKSTFQLPVGPLALMNTVAKPGA